jgi:hypothetical protein
MQCIRIAGLAAIATALLTTAPGTPAQSAGGPYVIAPVSIGSGGTLSGGGFELRGTLGQPATATLAGTPYLLHDGFWAPASTSTPDDTIFANGFDP